MGVRSSYGRWLPDGHIPALRSTNLFSPNGTMLIWKQLKPRILPGPSVWPRSLCLKTVNSLWTSAPEYSSHHVPVCMDKDPHSRWWYDLPLVKLHAMDLAWVIFAGEILGHSVSEGIFLFAQPWKQTFLPSLICGTWCLYPYWLSLYLQDIKEPCYIKICIHQQCCISSI